MDLPQALEKVRQPQDEAVAFDLEAHHLAHLPGDQAQTDAVEVADEDRPREEAGDKTRPGDPGGNQHQAHQHGDDHRQFDGTLQVAHGQRRHGPAEHGASGGIGADHQLPRAADQGIDDHRQHTGVKPVLRWQADNLRIGDGDRDLDSRHGQAGPQVGAQPFAAVVQQVGQAR